MAYIMEIVRSAKVGFMQQQKPCSNRCQHPQTLGVSTIVV